MINRQEKLLRERNQQLEESNQLLEERDQLLEKKNQIIEEKNQRIEELKKEAEKWRVIALKSNIERFFTKDDNAFRNRQERRELSRKHLVSEKDINKRGRKEGSKNFAYYDLEKMSQGNEVYERDILPDLKREHPDWEFVCIGQDDSYVLERVEAHVVVHKVITKKYKAKDESGKPIDTVYQALADSPIHHSMAGASLLADLATIKFEFGMPVYRYSRWLESCGFSVGVHTLYGWLMKTSEILNPVYEEIMRQLPLDNCKCIGMDETVLKVIDNIGDGRESCYVYLFTADHDSKSFRAYRYTKTREADWAREYLKDYQGAIVVDGYSGYHGFDNPTQRCLAHCRRNLTDIVKTLKKEQRKDSVAMRLVNELDEIFHLEALIKQETSDPIEILSRRQRIEYIEAVKRFQEDIESITAAEGTALKKAIDYYKHASTEFMTFTQNGDVPIDNNASERLAKSFATNRRSFLFCKSDEGAKAAAVLTTLCKTADANGLYPDEYIEYLLRHLRDTQPSDLMPWSPIVQQQDRLFIPKKKSVRN
jgi:transposase